MPSMPSNIFNFIFQKKKFWLIPIAILLLIAAVLIIFASSSPVSPFIYAMF
jgi:hypothetical protein